MSEDTNRTHPQPTPSRRDVLRAAAVGSLAAAAAAAALPTAWAEDRKEKKGMELIAKPCLARNMHTGCLVYDQGREYFVLTNTNEITHVELIFVDTESGEGFAYPAPVSSGAWALQKVAGNRLVIGTYYDGYWAVFDIPTRKWIKTAKFPGEDYVWNAALGHDGRVYGGTYPGAKLGAFDPDTGKVEAWSNPDAKPNLYLRLVSTMPDGRLYCHYGEEKPESFVFDPATKTFSAPPDALRNGDEGVAWNGYFVIGKKAYRMPDLAEVTPSPFPTPPGNEEWSLLPRTSDERTLHFRQGGTIYRYRVGDKGLTRLAGIPTSGTSVMAINEDGKIFGTRGQDYYIAEKDPKKLRLEIVPGPSSPRQIFFLAADDRNRLWGGPPFGQTLFYIDLKTGEVFNTRGVSNRGGEIYDVAVVDGVAYAVSYVGGEILRWDPSQPWNQIGGVNPRTVGKVGPEFIRPAAGITHGGDGKLYSGWWAKYGYYGGAIGVTDPRENGKTETIPNPLGVEQGLIGLAVHDGKALIGTTLNGNGLPAHAGQTPVFGVYDLAARKPLFVHPFPGAAAVTHVFYDPKTGLTAGIVHAAGGGDGPRLLLFDLAANAFREPVGDAANLRPDVVALAGPGRIAVAEKNAVRLVDLATGAVTSLGDVSENIHSLAYGPDDRRVYAACGPSVYRSAPLSAIS